MLRLVTSGCTNGQCLGVQAGTKNAKNSQHNTVRGNQVSLDRKSGSSTLDTASSTVSMRVSSKPEPNFARRRFKSFPGLTAPFLFVMLPCIVECMAKNCVMRAYTLVSLSFQNKTEEIFIFRPRAKKKHLTDSKPITSSPSAAERPSSCHLTDRTLYFAYNRCSPCLPSPLEHHLYAATAPSHLCSLWYGLPPVCPRHCALYCP